MAMESVRHLWWVDGKYAGEPTAALIDWEEERSRRHRAPTATCPSCIELRSRYGDTPPPGGDLTLLRRLRKARSFAAEKQKRIGIARLRRQLSEAMWWEILERDDFRCQRCGIRRFLTVDHVVALNNGGTNDRTNLQTLCRPCNSGKRDR